MKLLPPVGTELLEHLVPLLDDGILEGALRLGRKLLELGLAQSWTGVSGR